VIERTLGSVAAAVGGRLRDADPAALVTAEPAADSRLVKPGGLFVAVVGQRVDGHDFARAAVAAGAVAVLAARPTGAPTVLVDDVVTALGALARAVLADAGSTQVVGITGSSGKTTAKDLVAHLLRRRGQTVAPIGSYNTEIGLPLTVCTVDRATRHLVLEYSARRQGHIAYLCTIAMPHIGVVLNVGTAHLGEFGSRAAIAAAKAELVEALPADGAAILNVDDDVVAAMRRRTAARVVGFGVERRADVHADRIQFDRLARPRFRLHVHGEQVDVRLGLSGLHQVSNALAAAAVAAEVGLGLAETADALASATAVSRWRMEVHERADGVVVLNDAYNANPESMAAALRSAAHIAGNGRAWAVLGEMAELGPESVRAHEEVGRAAVAAGIHHLVVVGAAAEPLAAAAAAAGADVHRVPDPAGAVALLANLVRPGDVVLVKASRAVGLEQVGTALA
jgi:UDP-N-acetylmuramoyl-tripeptide--D-alanyl-D-alanine ligase